MTEKIALHQSPRAWGMPSASPFCVKTELFLRAHDIPYELKGFNPQQAPRGKMPYAKIDGEFISDSENIMNRVTRKFNLAVDDHLTEEQKHLSHCLRRMLEDGSYFAVLWHRWGKSANWPQIKADYFGFLPPVVRAILSEVLRKGVIRTCKGQGIARYKDSEVNRTLSQDLNCITYFMSESGPFFFGDKLSRFDYTAFAFLLGVLRSQEPEKLQLDLDNRPKLESYIDTIFQKYFSDLK